MTATVRAKVAHIPYGLLIYGAAPVLRQHAASGIPIEHELLPVPDGHGARIDRIDPLLTEWIVTYTPIRQPSSPAPIARQDIRTPRRDLLTGRAPKMGRGPAPIVRCANCTHGHNGGRQRYCATCPCDRWEPSKP